MHMILKEDFCAYASKRGFLRIYFLKRIFAHMLLKEDFCAYAISIKMS